MKKPYGNEPQVFAIAFREYLKKEGVTFDQYDEMDNGDVRDWLTDFLTIRLGDTMFYIDVFNFINEYTFEGNYYDYRFTQLNTKEKWQRRTNEKSY